MKRRDFLKSCVLMPLVPGRVPGGDESSLPKEQPNVLFLFSDQHHASAMGCAGHSMVKTPTLDKIAANGIRFTRAYCQDGICVPSRTAIMTGLYPRTTGCLDNPNMPVHPDRYIMLQNLFQHNGYVTGCFGKRHLPRNSMALGWDASATTINPKLDPSDENYWDWLKENGRWKIYQQTASKSMLKSNLFCRISELKPKERDAAYTADKTVAFLRNCKQKNKPFFCWATFHGPHQPYTPPQKWADRYPVANMKLPTNVDEPVENLPPELAGWRRNTKQPWNLGTAAENKDLYRTFLAYYYAQVTEVDHYVGVIVNELQALGLAENTIIIYASDHGDFMGHHGMTEKCALGHNVYEDTLRVPLILSWPKKFRKGVVSDDLIELIDLYPTLVDILGLQVPQGLQKLAGLSLQSVLTEGKPLNRQYAFSENWSQVTVIGRRYKLGKWIDPGPLPKYRIRDNRKRCPDILFDLRDDPLETHNLIDDPELVRVQSKLKQALNDWMERIPDVGRNELISAGLSKHK